MAFTAASVTGLARLSAFPGASYLFPSARDATGHSSDSSLDTSGPTHTDGSSSGIINVRIRFHDGTLILDSDDGTDSFTDGHQRLASDGGVDSFDPDGGADSLADGHHIIDYDDGVDPFDGVDSFATAATDPPVSDPWPGFDVTAFRVREDRPDFSSTGLIWASGSTSLWRQMLASSIPLAHTPTSTPTGSMPCASAGPPLPGRRLVGADSMCWNHVVGDRSLLINARPPPPGTNAESANGALSVPVAVGDFPVVLRDAAGVDVPVVLTNTYAMEGWPKDKILFSLGQLEAHLGSGFDIGRDGVRLHIRGTWHHFPCPRVARCWRFDNVLVGSDALRVFRQAQEAASLAPATVVDAAAALPRTSCSTLVAHQRMGFVCPRTIAKTADASVGLTLSDNPNKFKSPLSEAQLHGQMHRLPRCRADSTSSVPRNWATKQYPTCHADTHGPFPAHFLFINSKISKP